MAVVREELKSAEGLSISYPQSAFLREGQEDPVLFTRLAGRDEQRHKQGNSRFSCSCSVCKKQAAGIKLKTLDPTVEKDEIANYEGQEKSFSWVLEMLGEVSLKATVKIPIPDVCVFRRGKVAFILQSNRDRSLKQTTNPEKLNLQNIQKMFNKIVKDRKKEDPNSLKSSKLIKPGSIAPSTTVDTGLNKETVAVRCLIRDKINDDGMVAKDEEGPLRFMTSNEFFQLVFDKRLGDPYWKTISYIQTVLKCKFGVGEILEVTYYSHDSSDKLAVQELQRAGESQDDSEENAYYDRPQQYCMLLCRRIAYFLASHCQYEVLRIKGEFMRDDNGKIWLTWASRISVRPIQIKQTQGEILFKRVGLITADSKQKLIEDLDVVTNPKLESPEAERLAKYMNDHYEEIKANTGVNKLFEKEPPDYKTNEAFARLRPMTPYTLEELLDPRVGEKITDKYLTADFRSEKRPGTGSRSRRAATATKRKTELPREPFSTVSLTANQSPKQQFRWVYNPRVKLSPVQVKTQMSKSPSSVKWSVG